MWIFTQDGFYSVVQHLTKPTHLFVRARRRGDLERLAIKLGHAIEIEERPNNDYRWAAVVERFAWRLYLGDCTDAIDYTTGVKDHLDLGESDRHHAMYRVWDSMMSLQEGGKYNMAMTGVVRPLSLEDWDDNYSDADVGDLADAAAEHLLSSLADKDTDE